MSRTLGGGLSAAGNSALQVQLRGLDADNLVALDVTPSVLAPQPGKAAFGRVKVVPRKRFLRGSPQSRPFQILAESEGAPPVTVDGAYLQEPLVPRWALLALLGALLALLLLWFALIRPQIQSAAKDAVGEELAVAEDASADGGGEGGGGADSGGGAAEPTTTEATLAPEPPVSLVPVAPPTTATTVAVPVRGTAIDGRLFVTSPGSATYTVPADNRLQLTDIVLQNPNGNSGTVQLRRDGVTLLVVALDNFRDLDYHFVSPIAFNPGQRLVFVAQCSSEDCSPSMYYSGVLEPAGSG